MAYCSPCSYKMNGKNYSRGKMAVKRDELTLNSVALGIAVYGARASLYSQQGFPNSSQTDVCAKMGTWSHAGHGDRAVGANMLG